MSRVMARTNGKSEIEPQELDTQHELPPADGADEATGDPPQLGERAKTERDSALAKLGLRPIPAKGEPFDPHLHQAVEMVDTDVDTDEVEDHHVLDELQRGYKLKDRLLRPSMVRVARNSKH